ncbi:MAG: hypothetical protein JO301_03715 [Chitinophagaceae bacterium]|nr:hypothetical protein [Chitinophagaceae bacterium]
MPLQNATFFICFYFLFSTACLSQQTDNRLNAKKQDYEKSITLSGLPSRDTAAITFLNKKGRWYILVKMQNPLAETQSQVCSTCQTILSDTFLDKLLALKTEKVLSSGCRIVRDTIIDGKRVSSFEDFYMISDLERQTITVTKGRKTHSVSYLAPHNALKYCKDNANRLAFIRLSDRLLKIK